MKYLKTLIIIGLLSFSHAKTNAQACNLICPSNLVIKAESGKEGTVVSFPAFTAAPECGTLTYTPASGSFFRLGSHSIIIESPTGKKCSFTVTITDNDPPTLSTITLSRNILWPASDKMKKVGVYYTTADNSIDVKTVLTVNSNTTDGIKDWEIIDDHQLRLKASRLPDGSPRIYTITVTVTDEAGNKTSRTTSIAVSKTMTAIPLNN